MRNRYTPLVFSLLASACLFLYSAPLALAQSTDQAPPLAKPGETPTVFDNPDLVERYQATITPQDLAAHLYLFASDLFEGRETTTRGQKLAANYLASQYRKMGASPKGTAAPENPMAPDAYFQPFEVHGRRLAEANITVKVEGKTVAESLFSPSQNDDQAYLAFGTVADVDAGVIFAGYGIADDELGYNDFAAMKAAGLDHTGKWLMFFNDEPLHDAETSLLTEDGGLSRWSTSGSAKFNGLFGLGLPKGIMIIGDASPRTESSMAERSKRAASGQQGVGNLSLNEQAGGFSFPPIYMVSSAFANKILAPSGHTVEAVQEEINTSKKPVVFDAGAVQVISTLKNESYTATTENVLAFIEGSDPVLKDQVVIISSHYDHIGMNPSASGDQINNGADDDGSGTVGVLEIAEAFMHAKRDGFGPRRSLLFLNVTGEEKGLLGSAYYADLEPVLPLEKTVANLNIDMIGRFDPSHPAESQNYVYIIGSNLISQELHDINLRVNELTGTSLELDERFNSKDDPNQFYRRSDHWNFGKHEIPFIFFFTGTHEDYHQPGDEAHKIEYPRMARIAQLIFATAWQVANQDTPPEVSGKGFN